MKVCFMKGILIYLVKYVNMWRVLFIIILLVIGYGLFVISEGGELKVVKSLPTPSSSPSPKVNLLIPPPQKVLNNNYHIFQSFNNCGPAALSMTLSYYGISASQDELGQQLRPYQVPEGDNDDKSVTLEELAEKSKEYNLIPYHRPNGNQRIVEQFITYDIPIITRTWLKTNEDIGHYRIIKGFDTISGHYIQDDSLQGKNLRYSFGEFVELWSKFNYEYLVLVPPEKVKIAETILGNEVDPKFAWQRAALLSRYNLESNTEDVIARFNLSIALYNIGDYRGSAEEFEKVESKLPFRTLWYQIEPIKAYFELGNYDRVFEITDRILNNHNRAFSELYLIRGNIYVKQGKDELAKQEFEKAIYYNVNSINF